MVAGPVACFLALGLLAACAPASGASHPSPAPSAQTAKKKCKKSKKRVAAAAKKSKCKKKKKQQQKPVASPPSGPGNPPPPPPPPAQTTYEKIDAAVARGEITAEQGLTYKVFAAFGDPRLPGQYVGSVPDLLAEAPLDQVTAQWNQLSAGAKATLGPFLIPPMHEGSYWTQRIHGTSAAATSSSMRATAAEVDPDSPWCATSGDVALEDWHYLEAISGPAAGKVRIWYQDRYAATDAATAGNLLNAVEQKIWPALTTLMEREPKPDFGSTGVCAGGSDAVDIALVDADRPTTTPTLRQEDTPAHTVFPRTGSRSTPPFLAHEFMHLLQYAFTFSSGDMSSGENQWLREGTAQWVMDYVSDDQYGFGLAPDQTEKEGLPYFLPVPEKSLDSTDPRHHDYGSYIFWLWAARNGNDATIVRQVWNAVASQKSLNAAKSLFGGGWAQAWKDFTKANWNQDPVAEYKNWGEFTESAKEAARGDLHNSFSAFNVFVDPVAAKYLTFLPANDVNVLTYRNVGPLSDEAGVQAIITYDDGSHATEDWTQKAQEDIPLCDVKELTLVFSNASITPGDGKLIPITWTPPNSGGSSSAPAAPRAANVCIPDPTGTFSGTAHYDDTVSTVMDWSWSGNADFEPDGLINPWFPEFFSEVWDAATVDSGSVTMSGSGTVTGSDGDCSVSVPAASYDLGPGDGTMQIQPGPEPHYGIQLHFPSNQFPEGTISCPDQDPVQTILPAPGTLVYTPDPEQTMTRGTYQGSATFSNQLFEQNSSWNFVDP
jgi:hypothetical protein